MAEDKSGNTNGSDDMKVPPKLDLRRKASAGEEASKTPRAAGESAATGPEKRPEAPKQDTVRLVVKPPAAGPRPIRLDKAVPAKPAARPADARPAPPAGPAGGAEGTAAPKAAGKKETSRIPLQMATPAGGPSQALKPKTIRVKPAGTPSIRKATQPLTVTRIPSAEGAAGEAQDEKRKTSRIPLAQALAPEAKPGGGGQPKTIKIKRPSSAATVTVSGGEGKAPQPGKGAEAAGMKISPTETARLDKLAEPSAETAPSQKKTIRVKRPVPGVGPAVGPRAAVSQIEEDATGVDEPGWPFAVIGLAAVLVVGVLIYVQAAQAIGPNTSLTQLSYSVNGPNLPWPGKIEPTR